jgi:tetratricopeptide (TPR) repeat protein
MRLSWLIIPALGIIVAGGALAWDWYTVVPKEAIASATYVGSNTCAECHQSEHRLWKGSDHDRAMELATEQSVLGDFNDASFTYQGVTTRFFRDGKRFMVNTEGPDGKHRDYEIKYTFGVRPLQQYMVQFPDGRVQVLREAWDVANNRWFYVTPPDVTNERIPPGDPFHWTGITQNWNVTCADCHSTNVHKNYNPVTDQYSTTFSEINVSCEECHGPGSVHVGLARRLSPFWDREIGYGLPKLKDKNLSVQIEACAKCHARRNQIHEDFRPGGQFLDFYEPHLLSDGRLYHANGQILDEVYEYGSFLQSRMHANQVRCSDCHDPHSLKLKFTGNKLCTQCHVPGKYDTPTHHHHKEGSAGASCIECHMPARMYMVIDKRRDHGFRAPRPDLTVEFGTPNACNDCHTKPEETPQWAADAVRKWFGEKRHDDPHWTPAFAAGREGKPEGEKMLLDLLSRKTTPLIVQATAIDLLGNYRSEAALKAQREALYSSDPLIRLTSVRAIPFDVDPSALSDVARLLSDPVRRVRLAAVERLVDVPIDSLTDEQRRAFEDAMIEFRESQELSLDQAGGRLALAILARRYGRPGESVEHLRNAIRLQPYLAGPRMELASLLGTAPGNDDEVRRLREEEVELLERDAKLAPTSATIFYHIAKLTYLLGDYDKAQAAIETACRLAPRNFEFLYFRALLHDKRYEISGDEDQFNMGIDAVKKLQDLRPDDPGVREILIMLMEKRRVKEGGDPAAAPQGASAR